jgi:hypothetical protein
VNGQGAMPLVAAGPFPQVNAAGPPGPGGFPGGPGPGGAPLYPPRGNPGRGPAGALGTNGGPPGGNGVGPGGRANPELVAYLLANRRGSLYLAATINANEAAPLILATGVPVMSLGGFSGTDPILTADQLRERVRAGEVRFFVLGGGPGGPGGPGGRAAGGATSWIAAECAPLTIPGLAQPWYDCGRLADSAG